MVDVRIEILFNFQILDCQAEQLFDTLMHVQVYGRNVN